MCSLDTCLLPRKQLSRTSVSGWTQARVSYGGMCPGRGQTSRTGADDCRPYRACAAPSVSTDIHGLQPSRPGRVAVPWRIASIGLHSEVIQHPQLLPTPLPSANRVEPCADDVSLPACACCCSAAVTVARSASFLRPLTTCYWPRARAAALLL